MISNITKQKNGKKNTGLPTACFWAALPSSIPIATRISCLRMFMMCSCFFMTYSVWLMLKNKNAIDAWYSWWQTHIPKKAPLPSGFTAQQIVLIIRLFCLTTVKCEILNIYINTIPMTQDGDPRIFLSI